jgi:hypothetical protein
MLRVDRVSWALAFLPFAAMTVACGSDDDKPSGGQGGSTASSSSSASSTASSGGAGGTEWTCEAGEGTTLALTRLNFGPGNSGEWKKIGLNVDGKVSTADSTDLCMPNSMGDPVDVYPDGDDGIDNSFGKNLLPSVVGLYPEWPDDVNNFLAVGQFNALMKMYCLPPTGDAELTTKVFGGTDLADVPTTPKYDGTDKWPVAPELLANLEDPESSTIVFEKSSVVGSTFDSGKNETFIFTIPMDYAGNFTSIKLTLYAAQITMTLSEDRKSATGGRIGGVLDANEFIEQVKKIGWMFDICDESVFDDVIAQVLRASDIMTDGTQDPTKYCDGISIGIEFDMKEVQLGDVGPPADIGMACP